MTTTSPRGTAALVVQIGAAFGLLAACFQLFANWFDATVAFLGETATVEPSHVSDYRLWLGVGGGCLVASVAAAVVRRGGWVAPGLLATLLALSALLFFVALPDAGPTEPARPTGRPCYSGSNDCPGG